MSKTLGVTNKMADYTLDWATAALDGANPLSDGTNTITATVSTPPNPSALGEFQYHAATDTLRSFYPTAGTSSTVSVDFSSEVSGVSFDIYDIDQNGANLNGLDWDDLVTIIALDALGNPVPVTFTGITTQIVTGNSVEGATNDPTAAPITVTIAGPIVSFQLVFTNGPDDTNAGWVSLGDVTFDNPVIPCFTRGTIIETSRGPVLVEDLVEGDKIKTLDNGFQPIRWVGARKVQGIGSFAPVLIKKGALGNTRDLLVSPAHRMMLDGWQTELLFGEAQLLASAKSLINDSTILRQECDKVEYFHILFDRHEIIFAEGAPTESFHPGETATGIFSEESRQEILALFPHLEAGFKSYGPVARSVLKPDETSLLLN